MFGIGPMELLLATLYLLLATLPVWPFSRIYRKAGFPPALAFLQLIPLVNFVAIFHLAFSEWPALRRD